MRNLFSESLQTSLVTARRKYNYFPWPPLHTWAVGSRAPMKGLADGSISAGLRWQALLLCLLSRQVTAPALPEICPAAPCQRWGRSQAPGFPTEPCARTSPHLPSQVPTGVPGALGAAHRAGSSLPVLQGNRAKGPGNKRGSNQTATNYTCLLHLPRCRQQQHL